MLRLPALDRCYSYTTSSTLRLLGGGTRSARRSLAGIYEVEGPGVQVSVYGVLARLLLMLEEGL